VLVLDLSPSMAATDVAPDRAGRARYAIDDLLGAARDGRVALVVFGEEPYDVTPLTDDVATVRTLLPPLSPSLLPVAGDRLAPALAEAGKLLQQAGARGGQVVVLTDGFADPAAAFTAAAALRQQGVTVNVVGVGTTAGAPLTDANGRFVRAGKTGVELARLDTDRLQRLAETGGGLYSPLSGLPALAGRLQAPGTVALAGEQSVSHWRDAGVWLLPLVLLAAAGLARRGWFT
jgi:Ca-activated chloride channel family protein